LWSLQDLFLNLLRSVCHEDMLYGAVYKSDLFIQLLV
jgi:hypothetical protein